MTAILQRLAGIKVLPVISLHDPAAAVPLAAALKQGGLPAAEITFRTDAAEEAIRAVTHYDPDILVAAGTVLDVPTARRAVEAGAKAIISPGTNPAVVFWCLERGIPVFPGCATPTEIETCMRMGLSVVKLFPADVTGGVRMVKALAGPYPDMRFIPTGGITPDTVGAYLALPAVLCCGGSWLAPDTVIKAGNFDAITQIAAETVTAIMNSSH